MKTVTISADEIAILDNAVSALFEHRSSYDQEHGSDSALLNAGEDILMRLRVKAGLLKIVKSTPKQPMNAFTLWRIKRNLSKTLKGIKTVQLLNSDRDIDRFLEESGQLLRASRAKAHRLQNENK